MRIRAIALTALAALVLAAVASPALADRSIPKAFWGPLTWNGNSAFPTYHDLGVSIYELDLPWYQIAPTRPRQPTNPNDPAYQWPTGIDYAVQQTAYYHMRLLLQIFGAPSWANGGHAPNYPPLHPRDLAKFMTAAARRYPTVHLWMIWGEPDRKPDFGIDKTVPYTATRLTRAEARAPNLYAQMLDRSYGALKAASKSNIVIGGDTYTTGDIPVALWIENMRLPDGKPPRLDMYGHNPFTSRRPSLTNPPTGYGYYDFSDLKRLWKLVNRNLAPPQHKLKIFLSEWTVPTAPDSEFPYYVTPALQARWITDAWRLLKSWPFVYDLPWIHLYDDPPGGSMGGLIYNDGLAKPGYWAFKAA